MLVTDAGERFAHTAIAPGSRPAIPTAPFAETAPPATRSLEVGTRIPGNGAIYSDIAGRLGTALSAYATGRLIRSSRAGGLGMRVAAS